MFARSLAGVLIVSLALSACSGHHTGQAPKGPPSSGSTPTATAGIKPGTRLFEVQGLAPDLTTVLQNGEQDWQNIIRQTLEASHTAAGVPARFEPLLPASLLLTTDGDRLHIRLVFPHKRGDNTLAATGRLAGKGIVFIQLLNAAAKNLRELMAARVGSALGGRKMALISSGSVELVLQDPSTGESVSWKLVGDEWQHYDGMVYQSASGEMIQVPVQEPSQGNPLVLNVDPTDPLTGKANRLLPLARFLDVDIPPSPADRQNYLPASRVQDCKLDTGGSIGSAWMLMVQSGNSVDARTLANLLRPYFQVASNVTYTVPANNDLESLAAWAIATGDNEPLYPEEQFTASGMDLVGNAYQLSVKWDDHCKITAVSLSKRLVTKPREATECDNRIGFGVVLWSMLVHQDIEGWQRRLDAAAIISVAAEFSRSDRQEHGLQALMAWSRSHVAGNHPAHAQDVGRELQWQGQYGVYLDSADGWRVHVVLSPSTCHITRVEAFRRTGGGASRAGD